jgi:hypothetical protein
MPGLSIRLRCLLGANQTGDSFTEYLTSCEQAHHQKVLTSEVVELARMNQDMLCLQELDGEFFIRQACGEAQNRVPSAIRVEKFPGGMLRHKRLQVAAIFAQALLDLRPQRVALLKQSRESPLRGCIQGQVRVCDDLQTFQCETCKRIGAVVATQATFICGSAAILERPLSVKVSDSRLPANVARGIGAKE